MLMLALSLLVVACVPDNFLPDTPIPTRTLESNDEYETLWSLSDIHLENCARNPSIVGAPDKILMDGSMSASLLGPEYIFAIDSLNGRVLWQIEAPYASEDVLLAQDNVLYRATLGEIAVEAYNIVDGALLWETELKGGRAALALYSADEKIFVSAGNDKFFVLNDRGEILEQNSIMADVYGEMNGIMYIQNNAFRAIDVASKRELWQVVVDNYGFRSSPIFDSGSIFLRTQDVKGYIFSIDQRTGKINWKVPQDIYSNLFLANRKIYFLSPHGYLVAIDRNSGAELSRVGFSHIPFILSGDMEDYCITGDPANNILVVDFRDNDQMLGLRIKNP